MWTSTEARSRVRILGAVLVGLLGMALLGCGSEAAAPTQPAYDDCAAEAGGPGAMLGVEAASGELRWTRLVGSANASISSAGSTLLRLEPGGGLTAFDAATGAARWCRDGGPWDNLQLPASVATGDGFVVVYAPTGELAAVDVATGAQRWSAEAVSEHGARVEITDGLVLVTAPERNATTRDQPPDTTEPVYGAFDLTTGEPVAYGSEIDRGDGAGPPPQANAEGLELTTARTATPWEQTFTVTDATNDTQLWSRTMHSVGAYLDRGLVLVVDQSGTASPGNPHMTDTTLIALRAADGTEQWRATIAAAAPFPQVSGDLVLWTVGSQIHAFDRSTGESLWVVDHGSPGRGGDDSESGSFRGFATSDDGTVVAGYIPAEPPYRD
jgi:outer membrane protein assembly factor BamB